MWINYLEPRRKAAGHTLPHNQIMLPRSWVKLSWVLSVLWLISWNDMACKGFNPPQNSTTTWLTRLTSRELWLCDKLFRSCSTPHETRWGWVAAVGGGECHRMWIVSAWITLDADRACDETSSATSAGFSPTDSACAGAVEELPALEGNATDFSNLSRASAVIPSSLHVMAIFFWAAFSFSICFANMLYLSLTCTCGGCNWDNAALQQEAAWSGVGFEHRH